MAVNLDKPANLTDLSKPEYQNLLAGLQANILKPHARPHQRLAFLEFGNNPSTVKAWIKEFVLPMVTTAGDQQAQSIARTANPGLDGGLVTTFFLSSDGYKALGFDTDDFESESFRNGMKDQSDGLFSDILERGNKDPKVSTWEAPYRRSVHAMVAFADDQAEVVDDSVAKLKASVDGIATLLTVEFGRELRSPDGKLLEHFGFADGISNPRFEPPKTTVANSQWDDGAPLRLVLARDPLTDPASEAMGSYFVFRKLAQDVQAWNSRVTALSQAISVDPELAGALAVGRFKDGTPVLKSNVPDPTKQKDNDFLFEDVDDKGVRCPIHAHIRKSNPRGTTPLTSLESERMRRIVRRAIPYGAPMTEIAEPGWVDPDPNAPRGLLFMCYQQKIERQFEFMQRTWVDNPNFPNSLVPLPFVKDTGDDPVIGQDRDEGQRWPKKWGSESAGKKKFNFESAVTLKGGEYFFAPSKVFLDAL